MGAFNWVVFDGVCPRCGVSGEFQAQTHIASDYGGDDRGRFFDLSYRLHERMNWYPKQDPRYGEWKVNLRKAGELAENEDDEPCYVDCPACGAEVFALILFRDHTPVEVVRLGEVEDWPTTHWR